MDNETFTITQSYADGKFRLYAKGRVDANNSEELLNALEENLAKGKKEIILNMSEVNYLSSIGIRAVLKIYKEALRKESKFYIEKPSEVVQNILGMAALKEMLIA